MAGSDVRVITEDPRKLALGCFALGAVCTLLALSHDSDPMHWAGVAMMAFLTAIGAVRLVRPSRLELDDRGLTFHLIFVTYSRRWPDIERIEIRQGRSRCVTLVGKPGVARDLKLVGAWPISREELASLLDHRLNQFGL